jgi:hypothetical protein
LLCAGAVALRINTEINSVGSVWRFMQGTSARLDGRIINQSPKNPSIIESSLFLTLEAQTVNGRMEHLRLPFLRRWLVTMNLMPVALAGFCLILECHP